jgi:hypothetical protein
MGLHRAGVALQGWFWDLRVGLGYYGGSSVIVPSLSTKRTAGFGWDARLRQVSLTMEERRQVESAVTDPTLIERWMPAPA